MSSFNTPCIILGDEAGYYCQENQRLLFVVCFRVTWETPIRKILGDSFLLADEQRTNDVTLVDLLSHRVGVARHEFLWVLSFVTKDQLME